jgi:hypothetical protein
MRHTLLSHAQTIQAHLPLGTSKSKYPTATDTEHGDFIKKHQEDPRNTKDRAKDLVSRFRGIGYQKRGLPHKKVKARAIKVAVIMTHRPSHFTGDLWRFYAAAIKWPLWKTMAPQQDDFPP